MARSWKNLSPDISQTLLTLNIIRPKETGDCWELLPSLSCSLTEIFPENPSLAGPRVGEKAKWEVHWFISQRILSKLTLKSQTKNKCPRSCTLDCCVWHDPGVLDCGQKKPHRTAWQWPHEGSFGSSPEEGKTQGWNCFWCLKEPHGQGC